MGTNELTPIFTEQSIERKRGFDLSNSLFLFALVVMVLCEAYVIQGVLSRHVLLNGRVRGKELPYLMWIPAFIGLTVRREIAKRVKRAEIRSSLAAYLNSWLGGVLLIAYLLIARLAEIVFG
jgi:hypothetical protein